MHVLSMSYNQITMSTYTRCTQHPVTKKWDNHARWIDDYFGSHEYCVAFSNGDVYLPDGIQTRNRMSKGKQIKPNYGTIYLPIQAIENASKQELKKSIPFLIQLRKSLAKKVTK